MKSTPSQSDLILAHFQKNAYRELAHRDWIAEITRQCEQILGDTPQDLWRAARQLHQDGYLIKVKRGVYKYDPDYVHDPEYEEFSEAQKLEILKRDDYRCVQCGRGRREGVELHVDHIKPKDLDGKATIENGQVLCSQHNFLKKNLNATESGKRMFIKLYETAKREQESKFIAFSRKILEVFDEFDVNGHIEWDE